MIQNLERQHIADDTNQQRNSVLTKEPSNTVGVLSNLTQANSATAWSSTAFSGVSGATEAEGLQVRTEAQETRKTGTATPRFLYADFDSEKLSMRFFFFKAHHEVFLLKSSVSEKGNMIIYVEEDQILFFLQEFLHREGFDAFSRYR